MVPGLRFEDIFAFAANPLQEAFVGVVTGPGLYILEAPMGAGKTEAALFAAYRLIACGANRGLYFALPTRLTSDKIHERVEPFIKRICASDMPPRLAHGMAWLKAYEHGGEGLAPGRSWFNPRKRALLHPFGVGTIDQALLGILRVKHYFVRLFGLAGKVVILDEVHSYDVYTGTLLDQLVRQLLSLGCTVIVLSATLTGKRRARLVSASGRSGGEDAYPMITAARNGRLESLKVAAPSGHEYAVGVRGWDARAVAGAAVEKAEQGYCVLCIANTVAKAQEWRDAVSASMAQGKFELALLHSRFPAFRREVIETGWLERLGKKAVNRPKGCVLVATQVVEQSVDIDADFLITELAPTDMLLQRMGRVWRHSTIAVRPCQKPEVVIVCGDAGGAKSKEDVVQRLGRTNCLVYQPYVLWRSWRVWSCLNRVCVPDAIRDLIERTYAPSPEQEPAHVSQMREFMEESRARLERYAHAAEAGVKGLGIMEDDERVATRYSEIPMVDVLLVRRIETDGREATLVLLDGGLSVKVHADSRDFPVTARLHKQLVAVPRYVLKRLGEPNTPLWLRKHFYNPTPVWEWDESSGALYWNSRPTGFAYDDVRGLQRVKDKAGTVSRPYDEYEEMDVFEKTRFDW
ncbi:MAG: CRISPR-associated helicase Cas3' [Chloroflexi bacterium]|nr:CRISPR-associated helicase Cas3' [Chloroflexota bacterium]